MKPCPGSSSVVESVPTVVPAGVFSATVVFESAMSVGRSLAFVTVIVNCSTLNSPPLSRERTRIE